MLIGNVFHNGLLQALEEGKFDLFTVFLVVQEMLTQWPKIVTYIVSTGPLQDFSMLLDEKVLRSYCLCLTLNDLFLR